MRDFHLPRCEPCNKVIYKSVEEAEATARLLFDKDGRLAGAYFKPKCGSWHLTTKDLKRAAKNRQEFTMSRIVFRDYQEAAVDSIFEYFGKDVGNPIAALPTGTGKSLIIAGFIKRAFQMDPGARILKLTHVKELIEQNMKALLKVWPTAPAGIYSAGLKQRVHATPIVFAGIQSVYQKAELFGHVDLILIDEGHLVNPKNETMYRSFINALLKVNPKLKVIGFTATAFRLGQGMLTDEGGLFTDICFDLTEREAFNWLIANGWLSRLVPKQMANELDITGVRMHAGEFILADLQEHVDKEAVTMAALSEAAQVAANRKRWLVFASGIEHTNHVAEYLETRFGITARAIHSKLTPEQRAQYLHEHKTGQVQALVNNNILTTGYDDPEIDCIVVLRPTASPVLWVQMLGRGTRPVFANGMPVDTAIQRLAAIAAGPKPNCLVLDFAGNTKRLGPINDPVLPRRRGKGPPGPAPVRLCEVCGCYSHASCRFCENPECGVEFPRNVKIVGQASMAELIAGLVPKLETFKVDRVIYRVKKKDGKPDSMRVDYQCGFRVFTEYVCLDHGGYAERVARQWWKMRMPENWDVPPSTHHGMEGIDYLKVPTSITVAIKGKYPEITGYEFDGQQRGKHGR
jgi:DNA repair protein RadD